MKTCVKRNGASLSREATIKQEEKSSGGTYIIMKINGSISQKTIPVKNSRIHPTQRIIKVQECIRILLGIFTKHE